ncbi:MAG: pentapeptide repeat-containing protein [Byssovorax sp.]
MEPATIGATLKVVSTIFKVGRAAYKVRQSWGLKEEEIAAIEALIGSSADLMGSFKTGSITASPRLLALHTALVARAFGTACSRAWADNTDMAPGFGKPSWLQRQFLTKSEEERRVDIDARLKRALDRLAGAERGGTQKTLDLLTAMVGDPLSSPAYQAFWEAFTNPVLDDEGNQARLIELEDPGARLAFERTYLLAYAEALASPGGSEVTKGLTVVESIRPRLVRDLLVRDLSTWKSKHIFGEVETPGVPNMPLGEIYVEPDGVYVDKKGDVNIERREPIRTLVRDLLRDHKIVIVRGDFGHGKSLTARTLACEWAQEYLTSRTTPSPDLVYPVFIKCGVDFANHEPSLAKVVPRALRNQGRALKLDLAIDDPAIALPPREERVVYVVDGLDEVALTPGEVDDLFKNLDDHTGERHRAVVLSRKGVIPAAEKLRGIPIVDVQHLRVEGDSPGGQVTEWLEKWARLSAKPAISMQELKKKGLLKVVTTPIILFMAALTWDGQPNDGAPLAKAAIYERFFRQIAAGKCQQDQDRHGPVLDASTQLLARLVELKEVDAPSTEARAPEARVLAMLWLIARIAWEGQRCAARGGELTLHEVTSILREEVGVRSDPKAEEMIRIGALLVLQADHHGGNDRILFGHKSFREFLVARYWASQLRRIVNTRHDKRAAMEKRLLGGRLLDEDDETFDFLIQILDGPEWEEDRGKVVDWAADCFNNETPEFADAAAPRWADDLRARLREAALAIGSSVQGSKGIRAESSGVLRSLLGWAWLTGHRVSVIASRLVAIRANLYMANLHMANLHMANLHMANLLKADLEGAILYKANIEGAIAYKANLYNAYLEGANLRMTILEGANLEGANLEGANLERASLYEANLEGANLEGANLEGANLKGANLNNLLHNKLTLWPDGFDLSELDE